MILTESCDVGVVIVKLLPIRNGFRQSDHAANITNCNLVIFGQTSTGEEKGGAAN